MKLHKYNITLCVLLVSCIVASACGSENVNPSRSKTERHFAAFEKWARTNGILVNKVRISPEFRGIVATERVRKGDLLVAVPSKLFVNAETLPFHHNQFETKDLTAIVNKAIASYSKHPLPNFSPRAVACAVWLLYQKNGFSSKWDAWLRVMPTEFDTPLMLEPMDLELLEGSTLLELSEKLRTEAEEMFDTIERKLFREQRYVFPEDKYTLEYFSWAFTTYRTRSFTVGLVPYADFFNHDPTMKEGNYYYDKVDDMFKVFASKDYDQGDEVMITYLGGGFGLSNTGLFYYYGFVVPHVAEDSVTMFYRPQLRGATDLNVKRQIYINEMKYNRDKVFLSTNNEFDPRLLFVLRLIHHPNASAIDYIYQLTPYKCPIHDTMPVSARMDLLLEIDRLVENKLSEYPEESDPIHDNDSNRTKTLKYLVESEKEVLQSIKNNVRRYIVYYYNHRFEALDSLWKLEELNRLGYCPVR
jgi:hypothetical protein